MQSESCPHAKFIFVKLSVFTSHRSIVATFAPSCLVFSGWLQSKPGDLRVPAERLQKRTAPWGLPFRPTQAINVPECPPETNFIYIVCWRSWLALVVAEVFEIKLGILSRYFQVAQSRNFKLVLLHTEVSGPQKSWVESRPTMRLLSLRYEGCGRS